jgi:hypothetical protein
MNSEIELNIKKLLKLFTNKYKFPKNEENVLLDKNNNKIIEIQSPLYSSKQLILFFYTLIEYYINYIIPAIDFNDQLFSDDFKYNNIKKIYPNIDSYLSIKIFNIIDLMYKTIKVVYTKINKGILNFNNSCINIDLKLETTLNNNIELLFYTIFYSIFPQNLKLKFKTILKISDYETKILDKCNQNIFENITIKDDLKICKPIKINKDPEEIIKKSCNNQYFSNFKNVIKKDTLYTNIETPLAMLALSQIFIQLRTPYKIKNKIELKKLKLTENGNFNIDF